MRRCPNAGHAICTIRDLDTEEDLEIAIPWEHRYHWVTWGDRPRLRWGADRWGIEITRGEAGITAVDHEGRSHLIPHGGAKTHERKAQSKGQTVPMRKASQGRVFVRGHLRDGVFVAPHWRELNQEAAYPMPERLGGQIHVAKIEGKTATVKHEHGPSVEMPLSSVPHYVHDLTGALPHEPNSGDRAIDSVLAGHGDLIGKGNDGIVYQASTGEAVKISTTVPYQPHNRGHRTPEEAAAHLRNEQDAHEALSDLPLVPKIRGQEHDGRYFLVKPWAPEAQHLSQAELETLSHVVEQIHERGWAINDIPQLGRDAQGNLWFIDLGSALPGASDADKRHDRDRLSDLFRRFGHKRDPHRAEAAERLQELEGTVAALEPEDMNNKFLRRYFDEWQSLAMFRSEQLSRATSIARATADAAHRAGQGPPASAAPAVRAAEQLEADHDERMFTILSRLQPMRKAEAAPAEGALAKTEGKKASLKAGQRWITVHPHGDDEKGVPVLIEPHPDGSHRIIGGAGGKLTHLRLHNVTPDTPENREKAQAKAKARRKKKDAKEAERQAGMSDEEKAAEQLSKDEIKERQRQAERAFVERVRSTAGGVDADLTPENLAKFKTDGARNLEVSRHHARQLKQANARVRELAQKKVDEDLTHSERRAQIEGAIEEEPTLAENVRELAEAELQLQAAEDHERERERRMARSRTAGQRGVADKAAEQASKVLDEVEDPSKQLEALGGRVDPTVRQTLTLSRPPSEEVERRATQALADAKLLHRKANGEELTDDEKIVVEKIAERHKLDVNDADDLRKEAARQLRRSEIQKAQSKKLKNMEADGDTRKAEIALNYTDMLKGIADDAHVARQLGFTVADKTPLSEPELAAIGELMTDSAKLREAKKQFKAMMQEVEGGDYDASRRAFNLTVTDADQAVAETETEIAQRAITERLLGMADYGSEAHLQAVAEGHYLTIADVGLAIGKQRYLDRQTVDAIGAKNAAVLNRWALESDGHETADLLQTIENHHVKNLIGTSQKAIAAASKFAPDLSHTIEDVGSLEGALASLDLHEAALTEVQREVGGAIGKMEALATQAQALRQPLPSHLEIQTGDQWDNALQYLHAAGLKPGDYQLDRKGKTVRIPQSAWEKLVSRESRETIEKRAKVDAIKRGEHDETGWLPPGFVSRPADSFNKPTPGAPRFWSPIDLGPGGAGHPVEGGNPYSAGLEQHVGQRIADGEAPGDILRDLNSAVITSAVKDPKAYAEALRKTFPVRDAEGNLQPMEAHADKFRALAEQALSKSHPGEQALHAQTIDTADKHTQEAIYRTLAAEPRLKLAHTPITALSHEDRRALRDYFYEKMGIDPKKGYADAFKAEADKLGPAPKKDSGTQGFAFAGGGDTTSAEWKEWSRKALEVARKFPSEGKALAIEAMGDRPKPKGSRNLTTELQSTLAKVRERFPDERPAELAIRVRAEHAPELTAEGKAAAAERADRSMRIAAQQWLDRHPNATQSDAIEALRERAATTREWEETKERASKGPPLTPADVHGHLMPEYHDAAVEQIKTWSGQSTPWATYVEMHGSLDHAVGALQDELKGKFAEKFREQYGGLTGKALRSGKEDITNRERHVFATGTPEQQKAYREQRAKDLGALQQRDALGKYQDMGGAGALLEKEGVERERDRVAAQQQGSLIGGGGFGGLLGGARPPPKAPEIKLETGERWSLGSALEGQLAATIPALSQQLSSSSSGTSLFADVSMDAERIHQQRAVKQFDANGGRIGLHGGTGFGKTATMAGALTTALSKGQAPHGGLFLVPAKIQGQFDTELQNFLEPGKYRWATGEGSTHEERLAQLKNPDLHVRVMSHQGFMRTFRTVVADHMGIPPEDVGPKLGAMSARKAAEVYRAAMDKAGIPPMFMSVDEYHNITHRESTEWGGLHALGRAATHPLNATHAVLASATPVKNDTSELYSSASLLDPDRYADKAEFMSAFKGGIAQNPDAIRRELSALTYEASIPPKGVERRDIENAEITDDGRKVGSAKGLKLLPEHQKLVDEVRAHYEKARVAHKAGKVDVEAIKALARPGRFDGVPEEEHEGIAKSLGRSLGMLRASAERRAIELAPPEINTKLQAMSKVIDHDLKNAEWTDNKTGKTHKGKASVVFANSAAAVKLIADHLKSKGIRAEIITGETDAREVQKVLRKFPRDPSKPREADVLIGTSSIEAGLNAQFAKASHHFDVPLTEKSYTQRSGRAYRQGQTTDVDNHSWHTDTDYDRSARLRLQRKTGLASVAQSSTPHLDETGIAAEHQATLSHRHQGAAVEDLLADSRNPIPTPTATTTKPAATAPAKAQPAAPKATTATTPEKFGGYEIAPGKPATIGPEFVDKHKDARGFANAGKHSDELRDIIYKAHNAGHHVVIRNADGKPVSVNSVDGGRIRDTNGNQLGMLDHLQDPQKSTVEIHHKDDNHPIHKAWSPTPAKRRP